jgi:hypothetical protein
VVKEGIENVRHEEGRDQHPRYERVELLDVVTERARAARRDRGTHKDPGRHQNSEWMKGYRPKVQVGDVNEWDHGRRPSGPLSHSPARRTRRRVLLRNSRPVHADLWLRSEKGELSARGAYIAATSSSNEAGVTRVAKNLLKREHALQVRGT